MELGCDGVLLNTAIAERERPATDGPRHAARHGGGAAGVPRRPHPEEAVRDGKQPGGRVDRFGAVPTGRPRVARGGTPGGEDVHRTPSRHRVPQNVPGVPAASSPGYPRSPRWGCKTLVPDATHVPASLRCCCSCWPAVPSRRPSAAGRRRRSAGTARPCTLIASVMPSAGTADGPSVAVPPGRTAWADLAGRRRSPGTRPDLAVRRPDPSPSSARSSARRTTLHHPGASARRTRRRRTVSARTYPGYRPSYPILARPGPRHRPTACRSLEQWPL